MLVSRDAVTLPLLQVGASIRERYQAQAQKCPLPFLYRAMKLCNDCDLNYRASKNKRLLVELTLIQVAQLTAEGDDAGVGRSPKQQLKPVFSQAAPTASGRPKTASGRQTTTVESSVQVVSPQSQGASPSLAKATSGRSQADTASSQIVSEQSQATVSVSAERIKPSGSQNATSAMKADALPSEKVSAAASSVEAPSKVYRTVAASSVDAGDSSVVRENRKVPRMKISTLGMSIKNPQREEPAPAAPADIRKVDSEPEEDFIFNERDLNYYWQEYAGSLPMEQVAIAKRMQVLRPVLLRNSTTFEVVVDNEIAAKDFTALIPELQTYLRGRLKNSKVVMKVRVSASTENILPVGRVEKFQMMARKNQSLMQLKEEFGLELY